MLSKQQENVCVVVPQVSDADNVAGGAAMSIAPQKLTEPLAGQPVITGGVVSWTTMAW
jgi:hypothetical protein